MAQISLRVDDDVKRGAEQTLADIGLSMSTAINVFCVRLPGRGAYRLNCLLTPFILKAIFDTLKESCRM